jgi:uncharacterized protein YndB with AHSA1/START domain
VEIHLELPVAASPERVFAIYADPDRVPEWRPSIREVAEVTGPMSEVGTRFTTRYRGRAPDSQGTVVASDPPRLHALAGGGTVSYETRLELAPEGTGSRLRFDLSVRLPGGPVGRLAGELLLRRRIERETTLDLTRLKELAEARP